MDRPWIKPDKRGAGWKFSGDRVLQCLSYCKIPPSFEKWTQNFQSHKMSGLISVKLMEWQVQQFIWWCHLDPTRSRLRCSAPWWRLSILDEYWWRLIRAWGLARTSKIAVANAGVVYCSIGLVRRGWARRTQACLLDGVACCFRSALPSPVQMSSPSLPALRK